MKNQNFKENKLKSEIFFIFIIIILKNDLYYKNKMGRASSKFIKRLNPEDALKDTVMIKQVTLGISFINNLYSRIVHTALFISDRDKNEDSFEEIGIVLEYGKYESKDNSNGEMKYEYINGGMRYGWVELKEFQENLASVASINLDIQPFLLFRDLIEKIKSDDKWDCDSYSMINHNSLHFCAKAIKILKAKYDNNGVTIKSKERPISGKKKDIIPPIILKALES